MQQGEFSCPSNEEDLLKLQGQLDAYPMRLSSKADQESVLHLLSAEDMDAQLDLRPFMQRHPFFVNQNARCVVQQRFHDFVISSILVLDHVAYSMQCIAQKNALCQHRQRCKPM